ncbi:MAG: GNAT family N-acetyltransferase [Halanaerobiales bacterium]|nr:GNAT family N-acetyltransferase [Halanaerobiales bacterium]
MKLYTARLKLIALTETDLESSLDNLEGFYRKNNLISSNTKLSEIMQKVYQIKLINIKNDPENYFFYTYWLIINKNTNQVLGRIGFKDIPDQNKICEVGYGIKENFRLKGYMTEALKRYLVWGFDQDINPINKIIARTHTDNLPSQKVLKKAGFKKDGIKDDLTHWTITKN